MDEALLARYWCHMCSQVVNPIMEIEIKCPNCDSGFVEEMEAEGTPNAPAAPASDSDQALGLWAPIMLGMLNNGLRRRLRSRNEQAGGPETDENDVASLFRRQQRTAAILEVLNDIQERMRLDSDTNPNPNGERRREHRILINPYNQALTIQGSIDSSPIFNQIGGASLGDYFIGPGIEQLLQHLVENDPNRHGTPPAQKEAVEAMPKVKVKVEENSSCSICLDEFETGDEAREMPCKHRFHGGCILPWLEMHSSCPVCRFQMPVEGSKDSSSSSRGDGNESNSEGNGENGGIGQRFWMSVPWPFNGLFSTSSSSQGSSENGNGNSNPSSAQEGNS